MPPKPAPMIATLGVRCPFSDPFREAVISASGRPAQIRSMARPRSTIASSASRSRPAPSWKSCHMPSKRVYATSTPSSLSPLTSWSESLKRRSWVPTWTYVGGIPRSSARSTESSGSQRIRRSAIEVSAPDRPVATEPGVTAAVESHRRTRAGEIEPAVEKCQSRREVLARIPESRRQRDRQASSGRVANDRNRAWIEGRGELAIGGQSVLQPRRMRVLRSEPIVEHVHWRPAGDADLSGQPAVGPRGAEYIGAAVQVENGLLGACAFGDDPVAGSPPRVS